MSLGFVLSSLSTLSTPFFQLKTQDKPIPHSFEGKKMREEKKKKSVLFPDIQTIFVKSALI